MWISLKENKTYTYALFMEQDRSLMYRRCVPGVRGLSSEFVNGWWFMPDYHNWTCHGEMVWEMNVSIVRETSSSRTRESSTYHEVIFDIVGPSFDPNLSNYTYEEAPNLKLFVTTELLNIKSENNWSEKSFDQLAQYIKCLLPENNKAVDGWYQTKKLVSGLGLPVQKIDICLHNCML
ncbi:hypothetical protein M9H77_18428 [Catharanthus roseus]|uniref:Uncharacterized protein n=1 Tax=Catharanthus roseus TaxID=4058 RepID=A0ACC0B7E8_CATRO|nr:hypothetical protein M9H77_18428 [Catharanthus roseus]